MHRRDLLLSFLGGASATYLTMVKPSRAANEPLRTKLGIVIYALGIRQRYLRSLKKDSAYANPNLFLEQCNELGAGGIQMPLGIRTGTEADTLRRAAEASGMFVEGIVGLPQTPSQIEKFDAQLRTARQSGANVVRVVIIPGRRYERFDSDKEFREFVARGIKSLELAEPVAARHRVRLAVENHKDQRVDERLDVFKRLSSEYVGACVDTGNSFALLEDPIEVVKAYAPYAASVHLKDQAVRTYEDGFLFADVALGDGFLDLQQMVDILRAANPDIHFSLETITRDPLPVPCRTEKYWATFKNVPGDDLVRTMRVVRKAASETLPRISGLSLAEQVKREEQNVKRSLAYAREQLGLK
jgi:sugar phosphate isomerase/epimerase